MEKFKLVNEIYTYDDQCYGIHFTTSHNGNMAYQADGENVLENRQNFADSINKRLADFVFAKQMHTANCQLVTGADKGRGVYSFESGIEEVDCLYTFEKDLVLNAFYADCTPVYIYDQSQTFFSIIHAGWQGSVKGIVYKALMEFQSLGVDINNLKVVIGPSISKEKFEVESDVISLIDQLDMIEGSQCYEQISQDKYLADVKKINKLQAIACGVAENNIYVSDICSYQDKNLFSFRQQNKTGRMLACIYKK